MFGMRLFDGTGSGTSKKMRKTSFGERSHHVRERTNEPKRVMTDAQLARLKEHKYGCVCTSILDPYLQPFWNWLVLQLPIWMAPNLITVLGLMINIITSLILIIYSPDCKQEVPGWALVLCALGLFFYQSLDAIDGKQARRTKSSSPLGELFDHGCDSVSTVFVSLGLCVACRLGTAPTLLFVQSFMAVALFYCAHWQTYVTGVLKFGLFDVTEAQVCIIFIHLITAAFGGDIWTETNIPILGAPLYILYVVGALVGAIITLHGECKTILYKGAGKNGSSIAGTSVLSPIIPLGFVLVPAIIIASKSTENIYEANPAVYILTFGLITAKVTNRLVVAHMTKSEMDYFDIALAGPIVLLTNQYLGCLISERYLLHGSLVWATFELCRYSKKVCLEICEFLNIRLFQIDTINEQPTTEHKEPVPKLYSKAVTEIDSCRPVSHIQQSKGKGKP